MFATEPTFGDASNDNLTQLQSGTYTVKLAVDGTDAKKVTVHLYDSTGSELNIGASGSGTAGITVADITAANAGKIDLGNGLKLDLKTAWATGDASTSTVTVEHKGDYSIQFKDSEGTDVTLTKDSSASDFRSYMAYVGTKLDSVSGELAKIGALTGRLDFKEDQVSDQQVNVQAAYDRIMDADMADEQVNASKYQILQQTAVAMLAQANTAPQYLLSLFK